MATRLKAALNELHQALGGRPYLIVLELSHPDAQAESLAIYTPAKQKLWQTRGMFVQGHDQYVEQYKAMFGSKDVERQVDTRPPEEKEEPDADERGPGQEV